MTPHTHFMGGRHGHSAWSLLWLAVAACSGSVTEDDGRGADKGDDRDDDGDVAEAPGFDDIEGCEAVQADPGPNLVRRLSHIELRNTLRDTLELDTADLVAKLPPELRFNTEGFTNTASGLIVTNELAEWLDDFAVAAAGRVQDWPAFRARFAGCQGDDGPCREAYVRGLGARLLRRPLGDEQVATFLKLFMVAEEEGDEGDVGARLVLEAMLQAPQFLYRIEGIADGQDGLRTVDDYEMASRLSYLLWASAPDPDLMEAADEGRLRSREDVFTQVDRMLEDPRALEGVQTFMTDWLDVAEVDTLLRSAEAYPAFDDEFKKAMKDEAAAFFAAMWREDRPVLDMYTHEASYARGPVAGYLGLDPDASEHDTSDNPERIGMLTQPAVLAVSGVRGDPSLVSRGLFVLHTLLCSESAPPPPDVKAEPIESTEGVTQRTAAEDRGAVARCGGCHGGFDPLGFAMEPFDGLGRFRAEDDFGNELRMDGVLGPPYLEEEEPFETIEDFAHLMRKSPMAASCVVEKQLQYALGRPLGVVVEEEADDCLIKSVEASLGEDFTLRDLIVAAAMHPVFGTARGE